MLDDATFTFLAFTAEDEILGGGARVRENVVHETGLFQGKLGFRRAIILIEARCGEFSRIHGLSHIQFPRGNIAATFEQVRQVLEREGVVR
jgi:predicted nucleotide-binding protein